MAKQKMETDLEKKYSEPGDKAKGDGVFSVDLAENAALALSLASERVNSAQTLAQLRQSELQQTLTAISNEYAENGKFRVTEVNVEKRKVTRVLVEA